MASKTGRREALIAALLVKPTVEEAAAAAGVSYRTAKGWMTDPAFVSDYRRARTRQVDNAVRLLQRASEAAVVTLIEQLKAARPADAIRAATVILDQTFRGTELLDLAERVAELERRAERAKPRVAG